MIAIGMIAGALSACGVKGDLEAPPAASLVDSKSAPDARANSNAPEPKVFSEQSSVRQVPYQSILPPNPPQEWSKSREYQSTSQPKSRGKQKEKSDEPFFLDPIL